MDVKSYQTVGKSYKSYKSYNSTRLLTEGQHASTPTPPSPAGETDTEIRGSGDMREHGDTDRDMGTDTGIF